MDRRRKSLHGWFAAVGFMVVSMPALAQRPPVDVEQVASRIVKLANDARSAQGRRAVKASVPLAAAARYFADYLATNDQLGHEADGATPAERAKRHGYDYCLMLENIAFEFHSAGFTGDALARQFVEGWLASAGHRTNLLDPDATETGVAVMRSERSGRYYAVQMLGRPRSQSLQFQVANRSGTTVQYRIGERRFALAPLQTRTHEECRAAELKADGAGKSAGFIPAAGDRFVVTRSGVSRN
jgi:uncharacterized protein YkwD